MSNRCMFNSSKLPFTLEEYDRSAEELRDKLQAEGLQASIERQRNGKEQSEYPMVVVRVRDKRVRGKWAHQENSNLMAEAERNVREKASGKAAIAFKIIPSSSEHIQDAERKSYGAIHLQCRFKGLSPPDCSGLWANGYGLDPDDCGYHNFTALR